MYSKTYGVAPANTTLTVTYRVGNGVVDNVPSQDLTKISDLILENDATDLDGTVYRVVQRSIAATNEAAAGGGKYEEEIEEVRQNAISYFRAQNRAVTREDYVLRAYAMPPQFGSVSKAYVAPDFQVSTALDGTYVKNGIPNPLAINFYILGYDANQRLKNLNTATKENLKNYLSYYRILTDAVNIKNAHIVNVGIDFEIIVLPNYNSNEVLLRCVDALKKYFHIDNMQINQPINLSDVYVLLDGVKGVQSVVRPNENGEGGLQIVNKYDGLYSSNKYDMKNATRNGMIYPPKDPAIFEVKYPDTDIRGKVVRLF
jgi:hypothetical protein